MTSQTTATRALEECATRLNVPNDYKESALDLLSTYALELPVKNWPVECAVASLYTTTCNVLSGYNLYDYILNAEIDKQALHEIYNRLQNLLSKDKFDAFKYEKGYLEAKMDEVAGAIRDPLIEMLNIESPADQRDLRDISQSIIEIAVLSSESTGRNPTPFVAAVVVLAFLTQHGEQIAADAKKKKRSRRTNGIDWDRLGSIMGRRGQTIRNRYNELVEILCTYARRLPMYSRMRLDKKNLHVHLRDILLMSKAIHGETSNFVSSLAITPPAWQKQQQERRNRQREIQEVYQALRTNTHFTRLSAAAQLVYVLMASGVPAGAIEGMKERHLLEQAEALLRQRRYDRHNLQRKTVDETDMPEHECNLYLVNEDTP